MFIALPRFLQLSQGGSGVIVVRGSLDYSGNQEITSNLAPALARIQLSYAMPLFYARPALAPELRFMPRA